MENKPFFGFCVFRVFRGLLAMRLHLISFFFDLTGRLFEPAAELTPDYH